MTMLVLTRREGESVIIGVPGSPDAIEVQIVGIRGDRIRIGFEAPTSLAIHRKEIADKIIADKAAAGGGSAA